MSFWNANFNPQQLQQGAQQWGQSVRTAFTDRDAMQNPVQYGQNLGMALLGGQSSAQQMFGGAQQGATATPYSLPTQQQAMATLQGAMGTPPQPNYSLPTQQQAMATLQGAMGTSPYAALFGRGTR